MRLTKKQAKAMGIPLAGEGASARMQPTTPAGKERRAKARQRLLAGQQEQAVLRALCLAHGLPVPETEYPFAEELGRKWRADYVFGGLVIVEIVGGVWTRGHHSRGQSQIDDMERRNWAQILGYLVLEFTPQQWEDGSAFPVIRKALGLEDA